MFISHSWHFLWIMYCAALASLWWNIWAHRCMLHVDSLQLIFDLHISLCIQGLPVADYIFWVDLIVIEYHVYPGVWLAIDTWVVQVAVWVGGVNWRWSYIIRVSLRVAPSDHTCHEHPPELSWTRSAWNTHEIKFYWQPSKCVFSCSCMKTHFYGPIVELTPVLID